jgi:hypothetical protein
MKRKIFAVGFSSLLLLLTVCSHDYNQVMKQSEDAFYKGRYLEAARLLLPGANSSGRDQLLFMMEAGMMLHSGGDFKKSVSVMTEAGKLADEMAVSISRGAAALVLNETMTNYRGEDHERVMIHMVLGLNRLMLNDGDKARVDFKKVNDMLRALVQEGGRAYKQNVMAKYLTAIAFEISADADNDEHDREFAYIEYKQVQQLAGRLPSSTLTSSGSRRRWKRTRSFPSGSEWRKELSRSMPKDAGSLWSSSKRGQGPIKVSRGPLMSDQAMASGIRTAIAGLRGEQAAAAVAIMAALNKAQNPIPKFVKRPNRVQYCEIEINNRKYGRTYLMEDVESTAVQNLEEQYGRIVGKTAAGIVTKAAVSIVAGLAAKKLAEQSDRLRGFSGIIGTVVGAGTGAALISQIQPDLRCWHTLPANFQLGRMFLPPGDHQVAINLIDRWGIVERLERTIKIEKIKGAFLI